MIHVSSGSIGTSHHESSIQSHLDVHGIVQGLIWLIYFTCIIAVIWGGVEELSEEELLTSPLELQLVILNLWPPEPWYDQRFLLVCQKNRCLDGY